MSRMLSLFAFVALSACVADRGPEATDDWYGAMGAIDEDVEEPITYMDTAYDDPMYTGGIGSLEPLMEDFTRKFSPAESLPQVQGSPACDGWEADNDLPKEFWAMITLHPRLYYKGVGCTPDPQPRVNGARIDSEEKYYGNFFIEDDSRGIFVLNDSKVAHYQMGDRVKIRVRGVGERFGLKSIVSHDIIEVDRGPHPIAWTPAGDTTCSYGSFNNEQACPAVDIDDPDSVQRFIDLDCSCVYDDEALVGRTLRAEGVVFTDPDTFGGFFIQQDNGNIIQVSLDSELNRRKVRFPIGSRIQVTGPTLNAFGNSIIIMKIGQIKRLD